MRLVVNNKSSKSVAGEAPPFRWQCEGPALLFALLFPTFATWLYFVEFAGNGEAMRWLYGIGKVIQFAMPLCWVVLIQRIPPRLGLPSIRGAWPGILTGTLIVGGLAALYLGLLRDSALLRNTPRLIWEQIAAVGITTPAGFLGMALFLAVIHSFLEEYYWRWFVFGQLRRVWPFAPAAAVAGIGFASHHVIVLARYLPPTHFWTATLLFSACVAAGGIIWAWLYERSGSLLGPWLSHLLVDTGLMLLGFDLCREYFA